MLCALCAIGAATLADAAPRVPPNDATVVERLPTRPGDPIASELRRLRAASAAAPADAVPAARLARRYFELAMAEGDPRYIGYAEAAMRPWRAPSAAPAEVLVLRALLRQYRHDFDGALEDLARAAEADPHEPEARAWRAAIHMVRADYAAASRECAALREIASELLATGCAAYLEAATGKTRAAYDRLRSALERRPDASAGMRLWVLTRLAEMASRLGEARTAERHFRDALALGESDVFLLAAFADFLLAQGRPREVLVLLKDWARADTLLLRLALAARALALPEAEPHARALGERFAAAQLRGDRLHMGEEARFLLELRGDARGALAAAAANWALQREPRDAAVFLAAALAARAPRAAAPVLDWLAASGFEDPGLRRLAAQLGALAP